MMPGKRSKVNHDPARGPEPGVVDTHAAGRNDRASPPGFGGSGGWHTGVALSAGLRQPDQDLTKWVLHQFIEVSASGKLIRAETAAIARVAKDFRNLIHPGRMQRLNQRCDRGTALTVVAAVEHVSTDFAQNPP